MLHKLFIAIFSMFLISNVIYYASSGTIDKFTFGIITGLLLSLLLTGVIASIQVLGSGLNATGSFLIFAISFYITLLFGIPIPLSSVSSQLKDITIGGNLVGTIYSITPYPINILILILGIIVTVLGIQTIIGGRTT